MSVVHQNLIFGGAFILTFEVLGAMGLIAPILAAVCHLAAATIVIFNSARLVRFGAALHKAPTGKDTAPRVAPEAVPSGPGDLETAPATR